MYTCYAIDDDFTSLLILRHYISLQPNLSLVNCYNDPLVALKDIESRKNVDVIFMDIEMPVLGGIELAQLLHHKADKIVFTSGYDRYALKSYELGVSDYLLKPFPFGRFSETIKRLFPSSLSVSKTKESSENNEPAHIFIKHADSKGMTSKVYYSDIIAIESYNNNVKVHTNTGSIWVYKKLSDFKFMTDNMGFLQIHRSYIISKKFVKAIDHNTVILQHNLKLPIGRNYKKLVIDLINS